MRTFFVFIAFCFATTPSFSQTPSAIIDRVLQAQQQLRTVAYTLERADTFVTGDTRKTSGQVKLQLVPTDSVFGCWFWGKRNDANMETIYDGKKSIEIKTDKKEYSINTNPQGFPHLLGAPGGQMLLTDLFKLDTTQSTGYELAQDDQYFYLTKHLPDIKQYDVSKRYTIYTINKKSMLPVGRRSHQETLGKVQDLNYMVKELWINDQAHAFDFNGQLFPADYVADTQENDALKPSPLLNKPSPAFELTTIDNKKVQLQQLKGKVVLLDFLEVWCGPCFASAPKIQALYDKYKTKGLQVYGVSFEKKQIESMKKMITKFNLAFPVLIGDEDTRTAYDVNAIPRYVLIDKNGNVRFSKIGYSDDLEKEIVKVLER